MCEGRRKPETVRLALPRRVKPRPICFHFRMGKAHPFQDEYRSIWVTHYLRFGSTKTKAAKPAVNAFRFAASLVKGAPCGSPFVRFNGEIYFTG